MHYLSQMLGKPVLDSAGVEIGKISDLAISTGEVFPRITSLAFKGPSKTPFMVSWRKYVESLDDEKITLNTENYNIRFSYLQPDEILLARDLLNKQIVDTQGLKVVRVNDLKLSQSNRQLRLLGAEVGARGMLRGLSPALERATQAIARLFGRPLEENIIAWNYMELVDRDLSAVKLSVTHKRLSELHPADVADILEQLDPQQRGLVFEHLDNQRAAETIAELEDEYQADILDDLSERRASELLAQMDPDDAADILGDLPYEKAEKLLWLMGVQDQRRIRSLLGYKEKTAGGIMTPEFVAVPEDKSVGETIEKIRSMSEDLETVHYVYTLGTDSRLTGALSLRSLVLADNATSVFDLATRDLMTVSPDDDQEEVADVISKYDLLAVPVVDENNTILGIVTIDDALDVLEEEHDEDLQIAGAGSRNKDGESYTALSLLRWLLRRELWFIVWAVLTLLITLAGGFAQFVGALVLMPFVLLIADDIVAFSINDLIEYDGSVGSTATALRLLLRNLVVGVLTAAVVALAFFAFAAALTQSAALPAAADAASASSAPALLVALVNAFLPTVIACFATILASVLVTVIARRRLDRSKVPSSTAFTLLMMGFGLLVQLALYYTATLLVA